ncbi:MAG: RNA signal recognition particle [Proteobacteria bacterium SG_bin7]|nr:MAG: RNA signal recognition particle [Proteobacteria bacterium SG_bin7]
MAKNYVDGFVLPVPKKNVKAYVKMATLCSKVWVEHGALDYYECAADDVKKGKITSFPQCVKLKKNEVVFFSYITYRSRKHRDQVLKRVFKDGRMKQMCESPNIFDMKRMIYGGFKTVVKLDKKVRR